MPKKRAVIVDHHRDKRLQLAAALKGPDLIIVMIESEQELFSDTEPTDLFVLRADMDRSSGYSMCNRLRSNERTLRAKIVIVAPSTSDPRLQQHKASPQPANAYIAPPLGLKDLRLQAYSLLDLDGGTVADDDIQAVEDDPFAAIDRALSEQQGTATVQGPAAPAEEPTNPKPDFSDDDLEGAFGNLTPGQKPKAAPVEEVLEADEVIEEDSVHEVPTAADVPSPLSQLSEDELKFVEGVFERVKTMPNAPPLPPGVKSAKDLRGPEAKIFMLREQLRERELELQRLRQIWEQHEHEYKTSAQRVAEMEIDVKAAQMGQEEAMKRAKMRDDDLRREQKGSSSAIDRLLEEKFILEKDLIEIVASKEKTVAELKRNVSGREREIEQLKREKAAVEAELVRTRAADDEALAQARAEADAALTQTRAEAEALLAQTRADAENLLNQTRSDSEMLLNHTREEASKQLAALSQQADQTLSATIARADEERKALQLEMQTDRDIAASKLADTEASFTARLRVLEEQKRMGEQDAATVRATLETKITELIEGAAQRDSQISALKEDVDRKDKSGMEQAQQLGELRVRLENLEAGSNEKLSARAQELEQSKKEKDELQARLSERLQQREAALAQKDTVLEQLSKEVQLAREEKDALTKKLGERLAEREKTIEQMDERYANMQVEKIQVEERLRVMLEERARLERLMGPESETSEAPGSAEPVVAAAPNVAAPVTSTAESGHDEESIPIADSDESALMGGSKKAG